MDRKQLTEWAEDVQTELLFFDPPEIFDDAILGIGRRFTAYFIVYDGDKVVDNFAAEFGSMEDAIEHFEFNVIGGWYGDGTPTFVFARTAEE